jgi:hypothetical protein
MTANIIKIKRSTGTAAPGTLKSGELAYSYGAGTSANNGDRLFFGSGDNGSGVATSVVTIGGKYFTDMLDQTPGLLTASSAIIVDSSGKIDYLQTTNLKIGGPSAGGLDNTITATNTNGNIVLTPNGTGYVQISGTNGLVIPVGSTGQQGPAVTGAIRYNSTTSSFEGYGAGGNWTSLGGVRSVDGKAYIIAETSAGAGNDTLQFYASSDGTSTGTSTKYLDINGTGFKVGAVDFSINTNKFTVASSSGNTAIAGTLNVTGHVTVEGVTSTGATGTGKFVFDNAPTITGHPTIEGVTSTGATGTGNLVFGTSPSISAPTITGHPTVEGVTATGATGTGKFVFDTSPTISGATLTNHITVEGVTSTGATGTGNLVFSASPTFTGTLTAATISATNLTVSNITNGYSTTVTAAGTTTLTSSSNYEQFFTGTTTQTVVLPVVSTLTLGQQYQITNNSTGNVTVQSSGGNAFQSLPGGTAATFTVIAITGTGVSSWSASYSGFSSITGTGSAVLSTSPTLVTPTLGVATATSINGLTISSTTGTLTIANSKTLTASNTLTFTGTDSSSVAFGTGGTVVYTSNKLSVFAATSSSELAGVISDETGSGALVFGTSPTLTTPTIATSATFNGTTSGTTVVQASATASGTLTLPAATDTLVGKATTDTFTNKTFDTAGTGNVFKINGTSITAVTGTGAVVLATSPSISAPTITGHPTVEGVTSTGATGTGKFVFDNAPTISGHPTIEGVTSTGATGTGKFVFDTSPTLVTPVLGVASATTVNKVTITAPATGSTLTIADGKTLTVSNTLTFTGTDTSSVAFGTGGTVAYTSNNLGVFASTTSAQLAGVLSDETGYSSGAVAVFSKSPTIDAPSITGHATIEGVTATGATGTGNIVFSASPTFTGTVSSAGITMTGNIAMGNNSITGLATPTNATDAATKAYVDATTTGLDVKASVRLATTAALTATASGTGVGKTLTNSGTQAVFAVDGVTAVVGDRVLVKNQSTAKDNGIYTVTTVGTVSTNWVLTRATDADNSPTGEVTAGMFTFVEEGTVLDNTGWVLTTNNPITLDTTALTFAQFSGAGTYLAGSGLSLTGSTFSVNLATNSGLNTTSGLSVDSSIAGGGLTYTSGVIDIVGTTNRITVNADSIDISASYVGQSSITTLGTIATGTWQGTTIGSGYGGTGYTTYAKGDILYASASNTLSKLAAGNDGEVIQLQNGVPTWGVLDGGTY